MSEAAFAVGVNAGDHAQVGAQQAGPRRRSAARRPNRAPLPTPMPVPLHRAGAAPKAISTAKPARWALRIISQICDPPRPWQILSKFRARAGCRILCPAAHLARIDSYSTTKGADCAISCFEIASFIFTVTLYLPGGRPAIGSVFSTVNWSLCAPKSFDSSSFCRITVAGRGVGDLVGNRRRVALGGRRRFPGCKPASRSSGPGCALKLTGVAGLALTRGRTKVLPMMKLPLADLARGDGVHLVGQNQRRGAQLLIVDRPAR